MVEIDDDGGTMGGWGLRVRVLATVAIFIVEGVGWSDHTFKSQPVNHNQGELP